jgi:hypothetical protein
VAFQYCVQSADIGRQQDRRKQQEQIKDRIGEQMFGLTLARFATAPCRSARPIMIAPAANRNSTVGLIRVPERPEQDRRRRRLLGMDGDLPVGLGQATTILHSSPSPCAPILEIDLSARR